PALHRLVDEGDAGDEYNFSPVAANVPPPNPVRNFTSVVTEAGPLRARLEARFDHVVHSGLSRNRRRRADIETTLPVRLVLSLEDRTTRSGTGGPARDAPGGQVLGEHRFRYSLFFHSGDWERGAVWRAAETALTPMLTGRGQAVTTLGPGIELEPDCIQMTACIPRPNGFDLRLLNASDQPRVALVRHDVRPADVAWITLGGNPGGDVEVRGGIM